MEEENIIPPPSYVRISAGNTRYYTTHIRKNNDLKLQIQTRLAEMFKTATPVASTQTKKDADTQMNNILEIRESIAQQYLINPPMKKKLFHKDWFNENNKAIHILLMNKQRTEP